MSRDSVVLTVPARGEFAKAVRMTAAALVSRLGMSYDEVDDVRMAAEEAFVYAVDSMGDGESVTLTFQLDDELLELDVCLGRGGSESGEDAERRATLATFILDSVCDRYEFTSDETGRRSLRIIKRAGTLDAG